MTAATPALHHAEAYVTNSLVGIRGRAGRSNELTRPYTHVFYQQEIIAPAPPI